MTEKNPAVALGRLGGLRQSEAQQTLADKVITWLDGRLLSAGLHRPEDCGACLHEAIECALGRPKSDNPALAGPVHVQRARRRGARGKSRSVFFWRHSRR